MDEIAQLITDYGVSIVIVMVIVFFIIKYGDKYLSMWLKRAEEKNVMIDSLKSTIEANTAAFRLVEKVIENNNIITKNYTDNSYKLENLFREHDKRAEIMASDIKVLKSKKGE